MNNHVKKLTARVISVRGGNKALKPSTETVIKNYQCDILDTKKVL